MENFIVMKKNLFINCMCIITYLLSLLILSNKFLRYICNIYYICFSIYILYEVVCFIKNKYFSVARIVNVNILNVMHLFICDKGMANYSVLSTIKLFMSNKIVTKYYFQIENCVFIIECIWYFMIVLVGIYIVYRGKKGSLKKFIMYILVGLCTIVINFAGIYSSLNQMYYRYGYYNFKIDQGMNYSQAVMAIDFIYYSVDCFLGSSISDVRIYPPDYTELQDNKSTMHIYPDKYDGSERAYAIIRFLSMLESAIFLVYISMIIADISSKEDRQNEDKLNEMYEKVIKIESDIEEIKKNAKKYYLMENKLEKVKNILNIFRK